jgi:hypothetical protein
LHSAALKPKNQPLMGQGLMRDQRGDQWLDIGERQGIVGPKLFFEYFSLRRVKANAFYNVLKA